MSTKSGLSRGKLVRWKDDKGFGFIKMANGKEEIFIHISELKESTRRPQVGDTIYFYQAQKEGKIQAQKAFIEGARQQQTAKSPKVNNVIKNAFPWLEILLLCILPCIGSIMFLLKTGIPLPLLAYLLVSCVTFFMYTEDKSRAQKSKWRIPENTLHLAEMLGGWIGAFIAQRMIRHKSSKQSYQIIFWSIVVIHQAVWIIFVLFSDQFLR